jgi:hypothetical protein
MFKKDLYLRRFVSPNLCFNCSFSLHSFLSSQLCRHQGHLSLQLLGHFQKLEILK